MKNIIVQSIKLQTVESLKILWLFEAVRYNSLVSKPPYMK